MKNILTIALAFGLLSAALMPATYAASSKKCIVSGETVGGDNGTPVEVTAPGGDKILLCCKSCAKKFNANPEKYLGAAKRVTRKKA